MRKLIITLLLAAAVVVGLGFYLNWFILEQNGDEDRTTISLSIDKGKIQSDMGQAGEKIRAMAGGAKNAGGD